MQKRIAQTRSRVLPVALVQDIVRIQSKCYLAPISTRRIPRAQVEQVVARHANRIIARRFLRPGVTPSRQQMQPSDERNINVREHGRMETRHVDDLLVVEVWRAASR